MTAHQLLLDAWIWRPGIALALVAAFNGHLAHFRLVHPARTAAFLGAAAAVVIAFMSPVAALARGTLFSAHMCQHMLLASAAPPLALLAIPRSMSSNADRRGSPAVGPCAACWAAGVGAMWLWHVPRLCNAAATNDAVWALQSVSLPLLGASFWWPILAPRLDQRLPEPAAIAYLFTACAACTVLGISITFSPVQVCSAYAHPADLSGALSLLRGRWGLTPLVDQQLGGLLMWIPGCIVYAGAILALVTRFFTAPSAEAPEMIS